MEKNYLTIDKISAYNIAFEFSNQVWELVVKWDYFAKDTIGKQFVKAADSIPANISEGFGRYSKKDKIRFYRISMGSLEETGDWIRKSFKRGLLSKDAYSIYSEKIYNIRLEVLHLIKFTNEKLKY